MWWALHHHVVGAPHSSLTHTTPHCYIQASHYGLFLIHEKFLSFFWWVMHDNSKSRVSAAWAAKDRKCEYPFYGSTNARLGLSQSGGLGRGWRQGEDLWIWIRLLEQPPLTTGSLTVK